MPVPIVRRRTNSDFPGIDLPPPVRDGRADHPGRFDDAEYSECEVLADATVLVPWDEDDDGDDDDDDGGVVGVGEDGGGGGGGGAPSSSR